MTLTFTDISETTIKAWHDFALIELEREADARWTASAAVLGDSFALRDQQELFLVGSNDGQEQSVKFGRVTNTVVKRGKRHSAVIQTSFDRTGGSSGSPVFDAAGRVVAVHTGGTDTTSFELRIEYVRDALRQLLESGRVWRGDVGLELELIPVAEARRATRLPDGVARRIAAAPVGRQQAIQVTYVLPGSPAAGRIRAGDVLDLALSRALREVGDGQRRLRGDGWLIGADVAPRDDLDREHASAELRGLLLCRPALPDHDGQRADHDDAQRDEQPAQALGAGRHLRAQHRRGGRPARRGGRPASCANLACNRFGRSCRAGRRGNPWWWSWRWSL